MFQTAHRLTRILFLAGAAVLVAPNLGQAQHGGGHGGGGHVGGGHVGGGSFGGRGGFGGHVGGVRSFGGYRSAFPHEYRRFGYSRPYLNYYGGYYPYYGGYPYYDYSGGLDYGYGATAEPVYTDSLDGASSLVAPGASYQFYPSPSLGIPAQITVRVPADAQVWFDGTLMTSTGPVRSYQSPPLPSGHYQYDVRARWLENGREVTQAQNIGVTPGGVVEVNFPVRPDGAQEKAPTQQPPTSGR